MKILKTGIWLIIVFFMLSQMTAKAQYYSSGQDPASVQWQQIKTSHFQVIFPEGYQQTAGYVANVLEYAFTMANKTMITNPKKIPVILHNLSAVSNAQTVWAPARMDFYTIPPQDTYGQEWFQQLAIHEYRHIIQLSKMNQGMTKILTYLFGEQITAAVLGLYVPFWFIEGDAVSAETGQSSTGRGRTPAFSMPLRAQIIEKEIYTYDQAIFGSFKKFTPDHYVLGYNVVAQTRNKYGFEIWDKTMNKVGKNPYMIVPFSEGIRDFTGKTKTGLYEASLQELGESWKKQAGEITYSQPKYLPCGKEEKYTNYLRPFHTSRGTIVAEKKVLDDLTRIVEIFPDGTEKIICTPGYYAHGVLTYAKNASSMNNGAGMSALTYSKNLISWTEPQPDPRWGNRDYSIIKILDLDSRKIKKITSKSRYFAPALSPDATKIAVSGATENNLYFLAIIDVASGLEINRFTTPENYFFTNPSWSADGQTIVSILMGEPGKCIVLTEIKTGVTRAVSEFSFTDISKPILKGNYIVFTGAYSGIDNIYALHLKTKEISQVASVKFGVTDPRFSVSGDSLLFANYTSDGFKISSIAFDSLNFTPLNQVSDNSVKLYKAIAAQEGAILNPDSIPEQDYEAKKYSKLTHLFKFHSWAPISIDASNFVVKPGVSLMSQNILSTTFTSLGYAYDLNEKTGKYYINLSYQGLYPVFDFQADFGKRNSYTYDTADNRIDYSWMETNFTTTVRVPLNFTSGKFGRFVQPSVAFTYLQLDMDEDATVAFKRNNYKTISFRLYAYNLLKRVEQDMNPRWGQMIDLNLFTAPFIKSDTLGSMFSAETRLYFPGIWKHHSFNVYGGYQKRFDNQIYYYSTVVNYPRGYILPVMDDLSSVSANYKLPIFYPDFSLTSLAYLKRFKANLFYDYAWGNHRGSFANYQSAGMELFMDMHVLRFLAPIELGYRLIYLPEKNDFKSEFLFSINVYAF